jgi:hypothetical protein
MSTEHDRVRQLAERIAQRVTQSSQPYRPANRENSVADVSEDLAALRAGLSEIQKRLAHIESHFAHEGCDENSQPASVQPGASGGSDPYKASRGATSPWLSGIYVPVTHSSQEKFGVEEAAVSELVDFFQGEKKCEVEPGGKPCDHCAMCSSRGF